MGAEAARKVERDVHDGLIRRSVDIELRAVNEEERSVEVVASSDTLDSHGDIVEQTFDLKRYRKNPVVLWMHNSFGFLDGSRAEDFLPIGRAENVKVADGTLEAKLVFFKDPDPKGLANQIFERFKQKVLRAVSIGFRPGKVVTEEIEGKERFRLSNNELFEISVVPMGSNPDAVAKAHALDQKTLRRLAAESAVEDGSKEDTTMDLKELTDALSKANAELGVAQKSLTDANAKVEKLETEVAALKASVTELQKSEAAHKERADKLEQKGAEAEVDALIGKKIQASQKGAFLKLRLADPDGFADIVKGLPELPILKDITGNDPKTKNTAADGGTGGATLADELEKEVAGAA